MGEEEVSTLNRVVSDYIKSAQLTSAQARRLVDGLRVLQDIATRGAQPITYATFAELLQPGLAPLATGAILGDIGHFCNRAGWPNVTCFVVSATTGEVSDGFTKVSDEDPGVARDAAWFAYAVYKNGPRVDDES